MAQYTFQITLEADTAENASETAQYIQGVAGKVDNKKLTKLLKAAFNKPAIITKALLALKIV